MRGNHIMILTHRISKAKIRFDGNKSFLTFRNMEGRIQKKLIRTYLFNVALYALSLIHI